ncbi:hypothetical protein H6F95_31850 [Cyanobacteria bacterium FACHB-471]|nr:hypothetical protein [Cyanobacteria bacterium FACHB-471]
MSIRSLSIPTFNKPGSSVPTVFPLLVPLVRLRSQKSTLPASPVKSKQTTAKAPAKATAAAVKPALAAKLKARQSGNPAKPTYGALVEVIEILLKPCHQHDLLRNFSPDLIQQSRRNLGVRFYAVDSMPFAVQTLLDLFPGSSKGSSGSRAILGRDVKHPIVLLVWSEFQQIATELGLSVDSVAEALVMHEIGHCAGSAIYLNTSQSDASFLSEEFGWDYGLNLHRRFGRSSRAEFERVADYCLKSHEK